MTTTVLDNTNDFSRKCRAKVNELFRSLRVKLEQLPAFKKTKNWNRFSILERAIETIRHYRGENEIELEANWNRDGLNNKELCKLYRNRLNQTFDTLLRELSTAGFCLDKYRTTSRAGILEAACDFLDNESCKRSSSRLEPVSPAISTRLPKPIPSKRSRSESHDERSSVAKRFAADSCLNDSGFASPYAVPSPLIRTDMNSTQLTVAPLYLSSLDLSQRIALQRLAFSQLFELPVEANNKNDNIWRPW